MHVPGALSQIPLTSTEPKAASRPRLLQDAVPLLQARARGQPSQHFARAEYSFGHWVARQASSLHPARVEQERRTSTWYPQIKEPQDSAAQVVQATHAAVDPVGSPAHDGSRGRVGQLPEIFTLLPASVPETLVGEVEEHDGKASKSQPHTAPRCDRRFTMLPFERLVESIPYSVQIACDQSPAPPRGRVRIVIV